jgi:hypothetical protein
MMSPSVPEGLTKGAGDLQDIFGKFFERPFCGAEDEA